MSSSNTTPDVFTLAREYLQWESNAAYRELIASAVAANDTKALQSAFVPRIAFGTAGLRARMTAGYHNMCDLVVRKHAHHTGRCMGGTELRCRTYGDNHPSHRTPYLFIVCFCFCYCVSVFMLLGCSNESGFC